MRNKLLAGILVPTLTVMTALSPQNNGTAIKSASNGIVSYDTATIQSSYEVSFKKTASWDKHINGEITITNTGSSTITDWKLKFDFNGTIENIWNASVIKDEDGITVANAGWNQNIAVGETVSFGFIARVDSEDTEPQNMIIQDKDADDNVQEENKLLFSYEVNTEVYSDSSDCEETIGYVEANEGEEIAPDAFYVAGDRVFIDNPISHSIMVYQGEELVKTIPLSWEMDVKLMYYDEEGDTLKIVYRNLDKASATYLYLTSITVDKGEKVSVGKELSNEEQILLEYCFDEKGELMTEYLSDNNSEDALVFTDEIGCGVALNNTVNLYTFSDNMAFDETTAGECILLECNDNEFCYAVPEKDANVLERGNLQVTDDAVYQMTVNATGVQIFELGEKTAETVEELEASAGDSPDGGIEELKRETVLKGSVSPLNNFLTQKRRAGASYKSIAKATVKSRMNKYLNLSWTFNSSKNSKLSVVGNSNQVTQPSWLKKLADGKNHSVTNVPYCWGGWNAETF